MPRRRRLLVLAVGIAAILALVIVWVAITANDLSDDLDAVHRCTLAFPTSTPSGSAGVVGIDVTEVTASDAAAEMREADLTPAPWDGLRADAPVERCASGTLVWFVDATGRRTQIGP